MLLAFAQSGSKQTCSDAPTCVDLPHAITGDTWHDGTNDCAKFEEADARGDMWCHKYGKFDLNGEGKAQDQCCTCGGGSRPKPKAVHFQGPSIYILLHHIIDVVSSS
jgi:hypothetical protein